MAEINPEYRRVASCVAADCKCEFPLMVPGMSTFEPITCCEFTRLCRRQPASTRTAWPAVTVCTTESESELPLRPSHIFYL